MRVSSHSGRACVSVAVAKGEMFWERDLRETASAREWSGIDMSARVLACRGIKPPWTKAWAGTVATNRHAIAVRIVSWLRWVAAKFPKNSFLKISKKTLEPFRFCKFQIHFYEKCVSLRAFSLGTLFFMIHWKSFHFISFHFNLLKWNEK